VEGKMPDSLRFLPDSKWSTFLVSAKICQDVVG
jgi:hypothetical protein